MDEKTRGIEIARQPVGFSITVGGKQVSTEGKAIDVRLENNQAYVYMLVDCSNSMAGYKLGQAKQGVTDFAGKALAGGYRVGLISFDTTATLITEPMEDIQALQPAIRALKISGSTNMAAAIKMAHEQLKKLEGMKSVVIATDGEPDNIPAALKAAQQAKDDGIDFITIGTDDADQKFLERLATRKELGSKVTKEAFASTIASASDLLPAPRGIVKR
jgi:Mg-chelatase subunit ChlD